MVGHDRIKDVSKTPPVGTRVGFEASEENEKREKGRREKVSVVVDISKRWKMDAAGTEGKGRSRVYYIILYLYIKKSCYNFDEWPWP